MDHKFIYHFRFLGLSECQLVILKHNSMESKGLLDKSIKHATTTIGNSLAPKMKRIYNSKI